MGLREKVALALIAVVIQATWTVCEPQSSVLNPFDRYARIGAKKILNNPQLYGQSTQNVGQNDLSNQYKFTADRSQTGSYSSLKTNTDNICPIKASSDKVISDLRNEARKKRKLKAQLAKIDSVPEHRRVASDQMSPSSPNEMAFPEVEYPVKIEDTWAPKYFNPLPYQVDDPHFKFSHFNTDKPQSKPKDTNVFIKPSSMKKYKGMVPGVKPKDKNKDLTATKAASTSSSKIESKNKDVKVLEPHNKSQRTSSKQKKLRKLLYSQRKPYSNKKLSNGSLIMSPQQIKTQENVTSNTSLLLCSEDAKENRNNLTLPCTSDIINNTSEFNVSYKAINQAETSPQEIDDCTNVCDVEIQKYNKTEDITNWPTTIPVDISDSPRLTTVANEIEDAPLYTTEAPDLLYTTATKEITFASTYTSIADIISDTPTLTTMADDYTYTPLYTTVEEETLKPSEYTTTLHETTEAPYITPTKNITESIMSKQNNSKTVILSPVNSDSIYNSAEVRDVAENVLAEVGPISEEFEPFNSFIPDNTDDVLPILYPSDLPTEFVISADKKANPKTNELENSTVIDELINRIAKDQILLTELVEPKSNYLNTSAEVNDLIERVENYSRSYQNLSNPIELDSLVEEIVNDLGPVLDEYLVPEDLASILNIPSSSLPTEYFIPEPEIPDFTNITFKDVVPVSYCPLSTIDKCMVDEKPDKEDKYYSNYIMDILNGTARFDGIEAKSTSNYNDVDTKASDSIENIAVLPDMTQNTTYTMSPIPDSDYIISDNSDKDEVPVTLDKQSNSDKHPNFDEFEIDNDFSKDYLEDDASPEDLNVGLVSDTDTLSDIISKAKISDILNNKSKQDVSKTGPGLNEVDLPNDYDIGEYSDELGSFDKVSASTIAEDDFMPNFPIDAFSDFFI